MKARIGIILVWFAYIYAVLTTIYVGIVGYISILWGVIDVGIVGFSLIVGLFMLPKRDF